MKKFKQATIQTEEKIRLKLTNLGFKMAPDMVGIAHYLNTTPEQLRKRD